MGFESGSGEGRGARREAEGRAVEHVRDELFEVRAFDLGKGEGNGGVFGHLQKVRPIFVRVGGVGRHAGQGLGERGQIVLRNLEDGVAEPDFETLTTAAPLNDSRSRDGEHAIG